VKLNVFVVVNFLSVLMTYKHFQVTLAPSHTVDSRYLIIWDVSLK